ncbi:MAG: hypothetical protein KDA91_07570 [Planctomycetaceae bacterium]|nr:hypothetical protein [Planctomycetaceae bacterium]
MSASGINAWGLDAFAMLFVCFSALELAILHLSASLGKLRLSMGQSIG